MITVLFFLFYCILRSILSHSSDSDPSSTLTFRLRLVVRLTNGTLVGMCLAWSNPLLMLVVFASKLFYLLLFSRVVFSDVAYVLVEYVEQIRLLLFLFCSVDRSCLFLFIVWLVCRLCLFLLCLIHEHDWPGFFIFGSHVLILCSRSCSCRRRFASYASSCHCDLRVLKFVQHLVDFFHVVRSELIYIIG